MDPGARMPRPFLVSQGYHFGHRPWGLAFGVLGSIMDLGVFNRTIIFWGTFGRVHCRTQGITKNDCFWPVGGFENLMKLLDGIKRP